MLAGLAFCAHEHRQFWFGDCLGERGVYRAGGQGVKRLCAVRGTQIQATQRSEIRVLRRFWEGL